MDLGGGGTNRGGGGEVSVGVEMGGNGGRGRGSWGEGTGGKGGKGSERGRNKGYMKRIGGMVRRGRGV